MVRKINHQVHLTVCVNSRLHISLLAMHAGGYRINGGIGFAIDKPSCRLEFTQAPDWAIVDQRIDPLLKDESDRLISVLREEQVRYGFDSALVIHIEGEMRTHFGFGSGTAIRLACLEALHRLNGSSPTSSELVAASGRGGTSGIGIHTYFSGGCVADLGKVSINASHAPSHQASFDTLPLILDQLPMPDWEIGICIPLDIAHKTEEEEREFFQRTCPLSAEASYETVYHAIFGLYAAIKEADRASFCRAITAIQDCAWKKAERNEYGEKLRTIEHALCESGADAVGMSSLGPSLFFLADDVSDVIRRMYQTGHQVECLSARPQNTGRRWLDD
jgi:beta-ribofuranosylaminobenzene 5'-phosphate synthase